MRESLSEHGPGTTIIGASVDRGIRSHSAVPKRSNTRPPVVTFFESGQRSEQAEAAFDLGRRAAIKPRMVGGDDTNTTWICSRFVGREILSSASQAASSGIS